MLCRVKTRLKDLHQHQALGLLAHLRALLPGDLPALELLALLRALGLLAHLRMLELLSGDLQALGLLAHLRSLLPGDLRALGLLALLQALLHSDLRAPLRGLLMEVPLPLPLLRVPM